ncbi:MAG: type IX secretion system sortase PorU [Gemmatimonadetes bacterium]|nr:type IX secretion system sortase PorU [Gemmatimonadota bacterium]
MGLPPGAEPRLHVLEARQAVAWQAAERNGSLTRDDGSHEDGSIAIPLEGPVQLGEPVQLRDQYAIPVTFTPQRQADGSIVLYDKVVVDVVFDEPARVTGWPVKDIHFRSVYESLLINERQSRNWRRPPPRPTRKIAQTGSSPVSGMIRVSVRAEGMYRVTAAELAEAGADLSGIDPARIRVLSGGGKTLGLATRVSDGVRLQEQPSIVEGGSDRKFSGDDAVVFYGEGPERWDWDRGRRDYYWRRNLYTRDNIYWIDLRSPTDAVRPEALSGSTGQAPSVVVDSHRQLLHEEDERTILRQIYGMNSGYDWYWESFNGNARNFPITMSHVVPDSAVDIRVGFWGWTSDTHSFEIAWNDSSLGTRGYAGSNANQIGVRARSGAFDGINILGLVHRSNSLTRLDWYEVEYLRYLDGSDGVLAFNWPSVTDGGPRVDAGTGAVTQFEMRGFAAKEGRPRVFVVSDELKEIVDFDYDEAAGSLVFQAGYDGEGRPPRYLAVQTPFMRRPSGLEVDTQQPLRDTTTGADDLIITHADFTDAAQRLADWRAADRRFGEPITTMVVDVQDIYDEFSGGLVDPMAIRSFVNHAYDHWAPRPAFVTLVGDGTYDYKNNSATSHPNWIPPYQDGESTYDEWYVRVEGEDRGPELAIGRLPVATAEEAEAVVDKIITYDRGEPIGPWQARVLLVADDLVNPAESGAYESYFLIDAERLARNMLPAGLDVTKLYIADYPLEGRTKPRARDEFIRLFNEGSLLLTYLGHGNPETLAHEQMFLLTRDLSSIDNGGRLPFMYTAASQVGVFDDPERQSMPEALLNMASGGVIGFISATRVGFHDSNVALARVFHTRMFHSGRDHVPVGLALMEAKIVTHPFMFLDKDVANVSRYSLMGDPTLRLARPPLNAQLDLPDTLEALQEARLEGRIVNGNGVLQAGYQGEALVRVFDSSAPADLDGLAYVQVGAPIYRGVADVVDGEFSALFRVPKDITYRASLGRASAFVTPEMDGSIQVAANSAFGSHEDIVLQGTAIGAEADDEGPQIEFGFKGQTGFRDGDFVASQPVLSTILSDASGINIAGETGHEIELVVDEKAYIVTDSYTSLAGDYRRGVLEAQLPPLEPGDHTIGLKAWDSYNNSTRVEATVRVAEAADAALSDLLFYPNPTPDGSGHFTYILSALAESAQLRVFALSGRLIDQVEAGAGFGYNQVAWEPPTNLAGGTYLFRLEISLTDGPRIEADGRLQVVP